MTTLADELIAAGKLGQNLFFEKKVWKFFENLLESFEIFELFLKIFWDFFWNIFKIFEIFLKL